MKKNIFLFSLILLLVFSLSACKKKDKEQQIIEEPVVSEEQAAEPKAYETLLGAVTPEDGVVMKDLGCTSMGGLLKDECADYEIKVGGSESKKACCMMSVLVNNGNLEDQEKIKKAFLEMYPATSIDIIFETQTEHYVRGKVKINGGDFANEDYKTFFAAHVLTDVWNIMYDKEGVKCSVLNPYVFPPYVAEGCIL